MLWGEKDLKIDVPDRVKARVDALDRKLTAIEEKAYRAKQALLQKEAEREWKKIQKRKPHWERVVFGNGIFAIRGMRDDEHPWKQTGIRNTLHGARTTETWVGPAYLHYFWFVCEASGGGLEDLLREPDEIHELIGR